MGDDAAAEEAFLAVDREVGVLFRRGRARAAEMSRLVHPELEGMAYSMLGFVRQAGRARLTDIGLHFGIGKATVSRQIRAVEGLGLVAREADPLDGRSVLVSLTADGEERFLRAREVRMDRLRGRLAGWDTADVQLFAGLLERFNG